VKLVTVQHNTEDAALGIIERGRIDRAGSPRQSTRYSNRGMRRLCLARSFETPELHSGKPEIHSACCTRSTTGLSHRAPHGVRAPHIVGRPRSTFALESEAPVGLPSTARTRTDHSVSPGRVPDDFDADPVSLKADQLESLLEGYDVRKMNDIGRRASRMRLAKIDDLSWCTHH